MYGCQGGGWGEGQGVWDGCVHTALLEMDDEQGPTVKHSECCSMLCGSLDARGVWGRMDTCPCMTESLHCSSETITAVSVNWLYSDAKLKFME